MCMYVCMYVCYECHLIYVYVHSITICTMISISIFTNHYLILSLASPLSPSFFDLISSMELYSFSLISMNGIVVMLVSSTETLSTESSVNLTYTMSRHSD